MQVLVWSILFIPTMLMSKANSGLDTSRPFKGREWPSSIAGWMAENPFCESTFSMQEFVKTP